jgi:hypothetical protein
MITAKEYRAQKVATVSINNNINFLGWVAKNFQRKSILWQDNRETFAAIFGKPHWHYRNEFYFHVWSIDFEGESYLLLTAKNYGTCIEMVGSLHSIGKKTKTIIAFAKHLVEKLLEHEVQLEQS